MRYFYVYTTKRLDLESESSLESLILVGSNLILTCLIAMVYVSKEGFGSDFL